MDTMLVKSTAGVFLVFLCAAWLSTARLNPTGAEVNEISAIKATSTTSKTAVKSLYAIVGNLKKPSATQLVRKFSNAKSASGVEGSKGARSHLSDEVDGGLMAFSADYHRPMHHPSQNN